MKWRNVSLVREWLAVHREELAEDWEIEFLTVLNQDVEIIIRPRTLSSGYGHISVLAVQ